ncbi:hypothetical protein [Nesterenkonia rhizosphaerae]|uniref:Helix-turn-helix domain-containing protein n=1 Tax=Nesterenkonia rhizosphaerae TaxID=1348272 RepID=A0ABP9G0Y5_9MICC
MSDADYSHHLDRALRLGEEAKRLEKAAAEAYDKRREAIVEAHAAGASYATIGKHLGITRGGAQSIVRTRRASE